MKTPFVFRSHLDELLVMAKQARTEVTRAQYAYTRQLRWDARNPKQEVEGEA